jgi:hypothetical protein
VHVTIVIDKIIKVEDAPFHHKFMCPRKSFDGVYLCEEVVYIDGGHG